MRLEAELSMEDMIAQIKYCEGKHIQQTAYSTYHRALTQICFGCGAIRTMLKITDMDGVKE